MNAARERIFDSIRSNLAASRPFDAEWQHHHESVEVAATVQPNLTRNEVLANFCASLELLGTLFYVAASESDAADHVRKLIEDTGAENIAISNSEIVGRVLDQGQIAGRRGVGQQDLFDTDLGITSAQWAIAETGTLVIEAEKEDNRLISLVPPRHLCIIAASQIRQTLGEILELTSKDLNRSMTFITGASRTSDIELTLAIGVHGPGELYIVIIDDEAKN